MNVQQGSAGPGGAAHARTTRLEDVAADVGLSQATVSLVLNHAPGPSAATRQKVLDAAARLGYRADRTARLLAKRRSHLLGVMMDVRSTFHAELVEEIQVAAEAAGYDLVLSTLTRVRDEQRAVETLLDFRCEALILLGPESPGTRLAAYAAQRPVISIGRRVQAGGVDVVRTADDAGVRRAVDHLVGLGHRAISFIDGGKGTIPSDRRRGYQKAMRRHKLADHIQCLPGDPTEAAGARAAEAFLAATQRPSALLAFNDRCALGVLDVLGAGGVAVSGDVSVVGYDDSPWRLAHVNLTTVSQDTAAQASQAVAAAVERLDGDRTLEREVVLTPVLVIRGTTGPPG